MKKNLGLVRRQVNIHRAGRHRDSEQQDGETAPTRIVWMLSSVVLTQQLTTDNNRIRHKQEDKTFNISKVIKPSLYLYGGRAAC